MLNLKLHSKRRYAQASKVCSSFEGAKEKETEKEQDFL
ncbi:hypothetical protein LINPERPRIM_LOCUS24958 [Linum perenne]